MPLYHFECIACKKQERKILTPDQAREPRQCSCGGELKRAPKPPTARVVERLDNGFMPKAVERLADAERLFYERSQKDPTKE